MITVEEGIRVKDIKTRTLALGQNAISSEDKQWVLDLIRREQVPVRKVVMVRAKNSGFNTQGIKTL